MADFGPRNSLLVEPGANPYPQYNVSPDFIPLAVPGQNTLGPYLAQSLATAPPAPADPHDFTDRFNTELTPAEEAQYQAWARANGRLRDTYDYDLRGAWKSGAATSPNGHLPDTYKKPNHPTFSDQSQYSGQGGYIGGTWGGGNGQPDTFTPSATNLQMMPADQLQRYFQRVEPNAVLRLPPSPIADQRNTPGPYLQPIADQGLGDDRRRALQEWLGPGATPQMFDDAIQTMLWRPVPWMQRLPQPDAAADPNQVQVHPNTDTSQAGVFSQPTWRFPPDRQI